MCNITTRIHYNGLFKNEFFFFSFVIFEIEEFSCTNYLPSNLAGMYHIVRPTLLG